MSKYRYDKIYEHRATLISPHYNTMSINPISIQVNVSWGDTYSNIYVYRTEYSDSRTVLSAEQADTFMASANFDKDLFKTLTETVGIDADVALMMCLS